MKRIWPIVLLTCIATTSTAVPSSSPLEVVLSHPESTLEAESGVVIFTMTNRSNAPIHVLKALIPFPVMGERLMNNLLDVFDGRGARAKYTSVFVEGVVYLDDGLDEKSFMKMNPGESLSRKIDLSKSYDLSAGGPYKVRFDRSVVGEASRSERGVMRFLQTDPAPTSNTLEIWINVSLLSKTPCLVDAKRPTMCAKP